MKFDGISPVGGWFPLPRLVFLQSFIDIIMDFWMFYLVLCIKIPY